MTHSASAKPQRETARLIRAHNPRREATWLLAALAVLLAVMAGRGYLLRDAEPALALQPYQKLTDGLPAPERTVLRALHAAVGDVRTLRDFDGFWPEASLLADDGVPPFAQAFLPEAARGHVWASYDGGAWVDYLGAAGRRAGEGTGAGADLSYILRLIDLHAGYHPHPHPGVDYDPAQPIAVQVWTTPGAAGYPGERLPEAGWFWRLDADDPLLKRQTPGVNSAGETGEAAAAGDATERATGDDTSERTAGDEAEPKDTPPLTPPDYDDSPLAGTAL